MVHKTLTSLDFHTFYELGIPWPTKGKDGENVCSSAIKDASAMKHGRHSPCVRFKGSELVKTSTVSSFAFFKSFFVHELVNLVLII